MMSLRTPNSSDVVDGAQQSAVAIADESSIGQEAFPRSLSPDRVRAIQRSWGRLRVAMWICGDLVAVAMASSLAQTVRLDSSVLSPTVVRGSGATTITYAHVALALVVGWIAVLALVGSYLPRRNATLWEQMSNILRAAVALLAVVGVLSLFLQMQLSRSFVIVAIVGCLGCTFVSRLCVAGLFSLLQRLGIGVDRLLIVGPSEEVRALTAQLSRTSGRRTRVVGSVLSDAIDAGGPSTLRESIVQSVARHGVTSVVVCGPGSLPTGTVRLLSARLSGSGVNVVVAPGTAEAVGPGVQLHAVGDLFLLRVRDSEPSVLERMSKAVLDRTLALIAIVLLAPVFLTVAVLIRRDSPGPSLFRQRRVGRNGRMFTIYKFRSMAGDAEERLKRDGLYDAYVANGFKLPPGNDPRITKLGSLLRRTSLDELPQLFNVVAGSMSLVGPRPVVPDELSSYGELANAYIGVRPGVTGYWQVNGRSDVGFPERAELDAYYYDNRSFRVDLRILARTVLAVGLRVGAH
jgi:exopolysaccharide biosynthesis polyprenyl glycosylphosphotransferase